MSAASPAVLRSNGFHRAAATAIAKRRARRHQHGVHARVRRARPQQRNKPSDHSPPRYEIQDENPGGITLVMADDRWQKIQQRRNEKKCHFRTSESLNSFGTGDSRAQSYNKIRRNGSPGSLDFSLDPPPGARTPSQAPGASRRRRPSRSGSRRSLRL